MYLQARFLKNGALLDRVQRLTVVGDGPRFGGMKILFTLALFTASLSATPKEEGFFQKLRDAISAIEVKAEQLEKDVKTSVKSKTEKLKAELHEAEVEVGKTKDKTLHKLADEIKDLEKEVRGLTKKK